MKVCPNCGSEDIYDIGDIDNRVFYCEHCQEHYFGEDYV